MNPLGDDAGNSVFVRCSGLRGSSAGDELVSRVALRLHVYAVLASIAAGTPGLITDDYLDSVVAETSVAALELCTAGLWTRQATGYEVQQHETMRMAAEVHRQLAQLSARCRDCGGHVPDPEYPGQCYHCGVQL